MEYSHSTAYELNFDLVNLKIYHPGQGNPPLASRLDYGLGQQRLVGRGWTKTLMMTIGIFVTLQNFKFLFKGI